MKPTLNEKIIETMFHAYLIRKFGSDIAITTPTSRAEHQSGFDGSLESQGVRGQLLVQFKSVQRTDRHAYVCSLTSHQHLRLLDYPPRTAFYVAATFGSDEEIREAQRHSQDDPLRFLSFYLAVAVSGLAADTTQIRFTRRVADEPKKDRIRREPKEPEYRRNGIPEWHPIPEDGIAWQRADRLIESFTKGHDGWPRHNVVDADKLRESNAQADYEGRAVLLGDEIVRGVDEPNPGAPTLLQWCGPI